MLTTDEVFEAFWSEDVTRGFLHSHSYTGNPLACAAANAVLDRFDAGQLDANRAQADAPDPRLRALGLTRVTHLRQRGMILAFDVPDSARPVLPNAFHLAAREHELLIRPIGIHRLPDAPLPDRRRDGGLPGRRGVGKTLNDVLA